MSVGLQMLLMKSTLSFLKTSTIISNEKVVQKDTLDLAVKDEPSYSEKVCVNLVLYTCIKL